MTRIHSNESRQVADICIQTEQEEGRTSYKWHKTTPMQWCGIDMLHTCNAPPLPLSTMIKWQMRWEHRYSGTSDDRHCL